MTRRRSARDGRRARRGAVRIAHWVADARRVGLHVSLQPLGVGWHLGDLDERAPVRPAGWRQGEGRPAARAAARSAPSPDPPPAATYAPKTLAATRSRAAVPA